MDATPGVLISTLEDGYLTIRRRDSEPMVAGGVPRKFRRIWMGSKFCFRGERPSRSDQVGGCRMLLPK